MPASFPRNHSRSRSEVGSTDITLENIKTDPPNPTCGIRRFLLTISTKDLGRGKNTTRKAPPSKIVEPRDVLNLPKLERRLAYILMKPNRYGNLACGHHRLQHRSVTPAFESLNM
jgi:hypothetical protein